MLLRNFVATAIAALIAVGSLQLPMVDRLGGLSLDMLFWLRAATLGDRHPGEPSPTVIIGIDEETYRRSPFKNLPSAMWTPQLAAVLNATLAGGARVVGLDIIMPISMEVEIRGYDREFLLALSAAAAKGKIVLSKVQHRQKPISPNPAYSFAVKHQQNIRAANLSEDSDGVIRRVPLLFRSEDLQSGSRTDTSFSLEIAARSTGTQPRTDEAGNVVLGDFTIPRSNTQSMLVNFQSGQNIPIYSLADLYACAKEDDAAFFHRAFDGKTVLIGATLDVEDRWLTSKRLISSHDGSGLAERCRLPVPEGFYDPTQVRDTIPGVFIHAQAVNDILRQDVLTDLPPLWRWGLEFSIVFAAGWLTMRRSPLRAAAIILSGALIYSVIATVLFWFGCVIPLFEPMFGSGLAYAWLFGYRFAITDRRTRELSRAFGLYIPPALIERMVSEGHQPELGGEVRQLSVMFSDIEGFTGIAESLSPPQLVRLLNAYLAVVTDIVESHGGFVDKYIGDGVLAVFGAPVEAPSHAVHAVSAALECQAWLGNRISVGRGARPGTIPDLIGNRPLRTRIGINTGEMLVGNVGSRRHLSYTVMGDAVNLAARLENANKAYGTSILVSETTVISCGAAIEFREVDHVRVPGRRTPVRVYEPLGMHGGLPDADQAFLKRFNRAMASFRARQFDAAETAFSRLAEQDGVSALFAKRAAQFSAEPPASDWEAIFDLKHL